jgi:hypothetical protein
MQFSFKLQKILHILMRYLNIRQNIFALIAFIIGLKTRLCNEITSC